MESWHQVIFENSENIHIFGSKYGKGVKSWIFWPPTPPTFQLWSGARFWYLVTLKYHMWTTKKCIVRQCMCTHVAHTLKFSKNEKKLKIFQLWEPCVPFGCTYFVSLYIYERFRYGSLSLQSIILLCKVEMQKYGVKSSSSNKQKSAKSCKTFGMWDKSLRLHMRMFY